MCAALIRYFDNYLRLHHSDLVERSAPLDQRLDSQDLMPFMGSRVKFEIEICLKERVDNRNREI